MRKTTLLLILMLVLAIGVSAHGEEDFAAAEELIEQKVPCDDLTTEQLELIGDYYMEQMHPGEQHEYMDQMMGGEDSESLSLMHINMAKAFYCGEHEAYGPGMMWNQQMGPGMMYNYGDNDARYGHMGYGMMGGTGMMTGWWLGSLLWIAAAAFLFGIIFWWTKKIVMKKK